MPTWLVILIVLVAVVPGALAILLGVIAMFFAPADYDLRRKRFDEGLCVYCGYDLRAHRGAGSGATGAGGTNGSACPACGRPVLTHFGPRAAPDDGRASPQ